MQDGEQNFPPGAPRSTSESVPMRVATDAALPPHPLDKRWYAHVDGQNYGPYTGHDIKRMVEQGQIQENDFFCPEGGNAWTQAKNEPLLGPLFRARPQPPMTSTITTPNGGTVVQVTNTMPNNNNLAAALLMAEGAAGNKSPGIALLLSLLLPGVGQMYNGQVGKGIAFLIGYIVTIFILLFWVVWIWSMVDAYQTAKAMNLRYQQRVMAGLL
jgi:TM2 domain-containing membrane protein YozV